MAEYNPLFDMFGGNQNINQTANTPGGVVNWNDIKQLFNNDYKTFLETRPDARIDANGNITMGTQFRQSPLAKADWSDTVFPMVWGGLLGAGLGGLLPGTESIFGGAAAGGATAGGEGAATLGGEIGADTLGGEVAANTVGGMSIPGGIDPFTGAVSGPMSSTAALSGLPDASAFLGGAAGAGTGLSLSDLANVPTGVPGDGGAEPGAQYQLDANGNPVTNANGSYNQIDPVTGQPVSTSLPPGGSYSSWADVLKGGQSALAKFLGIDQSTAGLLGTLGTVGAGLYGSSQLKDIYDQQRADRQPALAAYNNALANPNSWYTSAPAQGAADAAARALSVHGNPAGNPGDIAKMAANNLGGYNQYLAGLSGPAFGGQQTQALLGTQAVNAGTNAVAGGLGNATTPQFDIASLLKGLGNFNWNSNGIV